MAHKGELKWRIIFIILHVCTLYRDINIVTLIHHALYISGAHHFYLGLKKLAMLPKKYFLIPQPKHICCEYSKETS